jgi:hypothetical protein
MAKLSMVRPRLEIRPWSGRSRCSANIRDPCRQLAPGTTKELVADYVAERTHQRTIQTEAIQIDRESFKSFSTYQNRQLLAGWTLVALIAAGGIALIALGESIAGLVALVAELAILAGVFLGRQVIESKSAVPARLPTKRDDNSSPE